MIVSSIWTAYENGLQNIESLSVNQVSIIIVLFIDSPMFNMKYLAMYKEHLHTGTISKSLYG